MSRLIIIIPLVFITFTGLCQKLIRTFYDNNKLEKEYHVDSETGELNGLYRSFYMITGMPEKVGWYTNGVKDSVHTEYYENGNIKMVGKYRDGVRHGEFLYFDVRGNLKMKEVYNHNPDGLGTYLQYYPDSSIAAEGFLLNGKLDSTLTEYYPNGRKKTVNTLREGVKDGPSFVYDQEGKLLQKTSFKNGKIMGEVVTYYPNGNKKRETVYNAEGKMDGPMKEYYENGILKRESYYKNNIQDSISITYFENGNKRSEEKYRNGQLSGFFRTFYEQGGVKTVSAMLDEETGIYQVYNPDGIKTLEGHYKDGVMHGSVKAYYDNGTLKKDLNYVRGLNDGKNLTYHPNGELKEKAVYKAQEDNLIEIEKELYSESGNIIALQNLLMEKPEQVQVKTAEERKRELENAVEPSQKEYEKSLTHDAKTWKHGEWIEYHSTGETKSKATYTKGKLLGPRTEYYEDGTLKAEQNYSHDIKTGTWKTYYKDGSLKSESIYRKGSLFGPYKEYYKSGKLRIKGEYANNRKRGDWLYYDESGEPVKKQVYNNNELISEEDL